MIMGQLSEKHYGKTVSFRWDRHLVTGRLVKTIESDNMFMTNVDVSDTNIDRSGIFFIPKLRGVFVHAE